METSLNVHGHGAEICIGLISREIAERLVLAGEECSEELLTEMIGGNWFEVSDIWHFCGPYPDVAVSDKTGNNIKIGVFDGNVKKLWETDPLAIHRMCDEVTNDIFKTNCLLITVSPEKGNWGQLIVDDGFDSQKLQLVQYSPDYYPSISTAIGFVIDEQPVYWERANETEVNSPSFAIVDPLTNTIMFKFG